MTNDKPSLFTVGTFVALVSTHFERRIEGKRQIHKVHKNGNFTLLNREGQPDPQQWKPNYDGTIAHRTGEGRYRDHLEIWSDAIPAEIAARRARQQRDNRRTNVVQALSGRHVDLPEHALHQIETALKFAGLLQPQD